MNRYFKMTATAQKATWSKLSDNSIQIPTQFMVEGDAKTGYDISIVNDDLCGFSLLPPYTHIRSFYAVKQIIEDINTNGIPKLYNKVLDMRMFAWANYPMPLNS